MAIIPKEINVPSLKFALDPGKHIKLNYSLCIIIILIIHSVQCLYVTSQTAGNWLWIVAAVNRQLHVPVSPEVPWIASQGVQWTENSDGRSAYVCEGGPHSSTSQYILWFYCVQGKYVSSETFTSMIVHEYGLLGSDTV